MKKTATKKKVWLKLRRLAPNGLGKPWVAECIGEWEPGNSASTGYISGGGRDPYHLSFGLEPGKTYFCQEPFWKRTEDNEVLAEDDQIDVRRFRIFVDSNGHAVEITESV